MIFQMRGHLMRKRKVYDDDDGRTIANMNIDGMPWYDSNTEQLKKENRGKTPEFSKKEMRGVYWGALKAGFFVVLIFAVIYFIVIFLLTRVWK